MKKNEELNHEKLIEFGFMYRSDLDVYIFVGHTINSDDYLQGMINRSNGKSYGTPIKMNSISLMLIEVGKDKSRTYVNCDEGGFISTIGELFDYFKSKEFDLKPKGSSLITGQFVKEFDKRGTLKETRYPHYV